MRTYSQLLGVRRALLLRATEERARGIAYDAVLLSRWDVLWQRPLLPAELWLATRAAGAVYLPHQCAARWPSRGAVRPDADEGGDLRRHRLRLARVVGGARCRAQDQRACQGDLTAAAREILGLVVLGGAAELDASARWSRALRCSMSRCDATFSCEAARAWATPTTGCSCGG